MSDRKPERLPDYVLPIDDDGHFLAIYVERAKWSEVFPESSSDSIVYVDGEATKVSRATGGQSNEDIMERAKRAGHRVQLF